MNGLTLKFQVILMLLVGLIEGVQRSHINVSSTSLEFGQIQEYTYLDSSEITAIDDSFLSEFRKIENKLEYKGKMCSGSDIELNECFNSYLGINNQWVILCDSEIEYERSYKFLSSTFSNKENKIVYVVAESINSFIKKAPALIFSDAEKYNKLKTELSALIEKENIIITLTFLRLIEGNQKLGSLLISGLKLGLVTVFFIIWLILKKKYTLERMFAQPIIENMLFLIIIKEVLLIYYISKSDQSADSAYKIQKTTYLLTIVNILDSITRTFTWFLYLKLIYGIGIFRSIVTETDIKRFLFLFISLYVICSIDQILEGVFSIIVIYGIDWGNLKNIVVLSIIQVLCVILLIKSLKVLRLRLYMMNLFSEFNELSLESIRSINFKICQIK